MAGHGAADDVTARAVRAAAAHDVDAEVVRDETDVVDVASEVGIELMKVEEAELLSFRRSLVSCQPSSFPSSATDPLTSASRPQVMNNAVRDQQV